MIASTEMASASSPPAARQLRAMAAARVSAI